MLFMAKINANILQIPALFPLHSFLCLLSLYPHQKAVYSSSLLMCWQYYFHLFDCAGVVKLAVWICLYAKQISCRSFNVYSNTLRKKGTKAETVSEDTHLYCNLFTSRKCILVPSRYMLVPIERVPPQWFIFYLECSLNLGVSVCVCVCVCVCVLSLCFSQADSLINLWVALAGWILFLNNREHSGAQPPLSL